MLDAPRTIAPADTYLHSALLTPRIQYIALSSMSKGTYFFFRESANLAYSAATERFWVINDYWKSQTLSWYQQLAGELSLISIEPRQASSRRIISPDIETLQRMLPLCSRVPRPRRASALLRKLRCCQSRARRRALRLPIAVVAGVVSAATVRAVMSTCS